MRAMYRIVVLLVCFAAITAIAVGTASADPYAYYQKRAAAYYEMRGKPWPPSTDPAAAEAIAARQPFWNLPPGSASRLLASSRPQGPFNQIAQSIFGNRSEAAAATATRPQPLVIPRPGPSAYR
jgi:hypothetical protein